MINTLIFVILIIFGLENYIQAKKSKKLINKLYREVTFDNQTTTKDIYMATEAEKAQKLADVYNAQKAAIAADVATIADLKTQIANGVPVTQDQLDALKIVDSEFDEVTTDETPVTPPTDTPVDPAAPTA